jgi:hypothetical protein
MTTTCSLTALAPLALLSLVLTACGGSALSGGAYPQELPTTADATLEVLDRAENDLRLALGPTPGAAVTGAATTAPRPSPLSPSAAPPPPPASPAPSPSATAQPEAAGRDDRPSSVASGPTALSSDPCANACRALASMERATTHLCSLAGDTDARCEGARGRVKSASARVHAECPACSGS